MGIESDKLVFDYLSKVGDLAQTALPAARRMRLVTELRGDIDRARAKASGDSPAVVRRILSRLGEPGDIVEAAAAGSPAAPEPRADLLRKQPPPAAAPDPAVPGPAVPEMPRMPPPRPAEPPHVPPAASLWPRVSVNDILRDSAPTSAPGAGDEWWRTSAGATVTSDEIRGAGWTGGLIMPEFQAPPAPPAAPAPAQEQVPAPPAAPAPAAPAPRRKLGLPRLPAVLAPLRKPPPAPEPEPVAAVPSGRRVPAGPVEVLSALLLLAGAATGNLILLAGGWLLAYFVPGIDRRHAKFAVLGLPGTVLIGALVWLWGRSDGRWGAPLDQAEIGTALSGDFPVVMRVAAVCSALYLVWRGVVRRG